MHILDHQVQEPFILVTFHLSISVLVKRHYVVPSQDSRVQRSFRGILIPYMGIKSTSLYVLIAFYSLWRGMSSFRWDKSVELGLTRTDMMTLVAHSLQASWLVQQRDCIQLRNSVLR